MKCEKCGKELDEGQLCDCAESISCADTAEEAPCAENTTEPLCVDAVDEARSEANVPNENNEAAESSAPPATPTDAVPEAAESSPQPNIVADAQPQYQQPQYQQPQYQQPQYQQPQYQQPQYQQPQYQQPQYQQPQYQYPYMPAQPVQPPKPKTPFYIAFLLFIAFFVVGLLLMQLMKGDSGVEVGLDDRTIAIITLDSEEDAEIFANCFNESGLQRMAARYMIEPTESAFRTFADNVVADKANTDMKCIAASAFVNKLTESGQKVVVRGVEYSYDSIKAEIAPEDGKVDEFAVVECRVEYSTGEGAECTVLWFNAGSNWYCLDFDNYQIISD